MCMWLKSASVNVLYNILVIKLRVHKVARVLRKLLSMWSSAASHLGRRFIGVQSRESPIIVNFAPQKPNIGRIGERAGHSHPHVNITVEMRQRKRNARDAPFVKSRGVWT